MKKILFIICFISLFFLASCNVVRTSFRYKDSEKYSVGEGTVDATKVKKIKIEWAGTLAYITTYDGDVIHFYEEIDEGTDEKYQLHYYHNGDTLYIEPCASMMFPQFNFKTKILHFELPNTLTKDDIDSFDLDLVSTKGEVNGVKADDIDIDTVSGSITLVNLKGDKIDIDAVSGDITIANMEGKTIDIDAVSGNISFDTISGEVDCETVSGEINFYFYETDGFNIKFNTTSGAIENDFDTLVYGDNQVKFDINTISGNIKIHKK